MWILLLLQIYNVPVVFSKSSTSDHYNMMPSLMFFLCVLVKAIDFQVFLFCSLNSLTFRHKSHKFDHSGMEQTLCYISELLTFSSWAKVDHSGSIFF